MLVGCKECRKGDLPPIVSKPCQDDILPDNKITQKQKSHPYLEVTIFLIYRSASLLFNAAGMGVASLMLLNCYFDTAIAQTPSQTTISQVNALFVNPSTGDDKQGNGGESTPFKTITQALRVATPNTVIKLAKGTYSTATGEIFPLILKPGVSLQGNGSSKGRGIIISGGDDYLSRNFGSKNV
ncbi:hypothetical protein CBP15_22175, partial [Fischerella thermalis WC442]